jgi:membrane dipeptidase
MAARADAGRDAAAFADVTARAQALHRRSIVIDTEAPAFTSQLMFTDGMRALARDMLEAGSTRSAVKYALGERLYEEVRLDPAVRRAYVELWAQSGVTAASSSIYDVGVPWDAWDDALRELATAQKLLSALGETMGPAFSAQDIRDAHDAGRHAVIHNLQNTDPLCEQLDRLDLLFGLGVRIVQITYNLRNRFGDGCLERRDGGLSRLGQALVGRLNDLGILVDLSHCSDQTTLDAVEVSTRPVACTHTSARALSGHARAKTDEVMRAVADRGGYLGVLVVPFFLLPPGGDGRAQAVGLSEGNATLDSFVDHVVHVIDVAGSDAVGIGTDWSKPFQDALRVSRSSQGLAARSQTAGFDWVGWRPADRYSRDVFTAGFEAWDQWPNITAALLRRGLSEAVVEKILGANFLRVFGETCG